MGQYFHIYEDKKSKMPYNHVKPSWGWLWKKQLYPIKGQVRHDVTKFSLLISVAHN